MPRRRPPRPTEAQLAILSVLWRIGPATVRLVHEALPAGARRGYTTTLKLLQIMADRGLVERDDSQRSHVYRASESARAVQERLLGDLADRAFEGSSAKLVMRALAGRRASASELAEIRRLLDELEED